MDNINLTQLNSTLTKPIPALPSGDKDKTNFVQLGLVRLS